MSIGKVKKAVKEFLSSNAPEVLSIKGDWGVGKTFFWNSFVKSACQDSSYKFERYAYVSLFGISNLDELKYTIFEQTVAKSQIGAGITIDNLKQNAKELAERLGRKATWLIGLFNISWLKNVGSAIHSAAFLSIKDMLICLDDFERKGDELSAKDVFGIVSLLKEQRNCKVVFIFNDTKFDERAALEYKEFREKVIDVEVIFDPNAKEAASLAFSDGSELSKRISDLSVKLDISNIRILRKIERVAKSVDILLSGFEPEVHSQALQTLTLLGWCFYSNNEEFYKYIINRNDVYLLHIREDEKIPQHQEWDALLSDYGFLKPYMDELDLVLAKVIETGYVDDESLLEEANKINDKVIAEKSQRSFINAWNLFNNTFADNESELVSALENAVKENTRYLSPLDLDNTVVLLRDLGRDELASELIDVFIEKNNDKGRIFDLDSSPLSHHIKDTEVISKFNSKYNNIRKIKTIGDVLHHISERDGWSRSDEEVLFSASKEDFYDIIKAQDGKNLRSYIDTCLQFGRFSNSTEQQKAIAEKARKALYKIGQECKLNKIRMRRYGVSIEENDTAK